MRKYKYRDRNQILLLAPNLNDWLGEDHLARFLLEVVDELDLKPFYASYENDGRGQPPYDPGMMLTLLLYAYAAGVFSSRKIERATWDDVAFRYISGDMHPDHDTIAAFRKRHELLVTQVFVQTVQVALAAKMVRLGHVSIDGTKVRANASKKKRKSGEQLKTEQERIRELVGALLEEADRIDELEDKKFGKGNNGYGLPPSLKTKKQRAEAIRRALDSLEKQKKEQEEQDPKGELRRKRERLRGKQEIPRVNTTDVDSRIMLFTNGRLDEGYNAQIAVDDDRGIIVATTVTQDGGDRKQLRPMTLQIESNTGWLPEYVTADTGYFSESQMKDPKVRRVKFLVKPSKESAKSPRRPSLKPPNFSDKMRRRFETYFAKTMYEVRKTLVEPVFGAIKYSRGFTQFRLRGLNGVRAEWALMCIAHNVRKMFSISPRLSELLR